MKRYSLSSLALVVMLLLPGLAAYGGAPPTDSVADPVLRLLRFVPDTPGSRQWVTYGDLAAWHTSWGIPRIDNVAELDALERDPRADWMFIMPRQTAPPDNLGVQYLLQGDYRPAYGFDLFNLDRFLDAGQPPDGLTLVEYNVDQAQIAGALTATGYTSEPLKTGGTLYSIREDYEVDPSSDLPTPGKLGALNRIALLDNQTMLIARATGLVTNALAAQHGDQPSLAVDSGYIAALTALDDPSLADTGELVGVIMLDGAPYNAFPLDWLSIPEQITPEQRAQLEERLGLKNAVPLFTYGVLAFATRHTPGATSLILSASLLPGDDADMAAQRLGDQMATYVSWVDQRSFSERWALSSTAGVEVDGVPVALVVMRVDDPPPAPADAEQANTSVFAWTLPLVRRDVGFLSAWGQPGQ